MDEIRTHQQSITYIFSFTIWILTNKYIPLTVRQDARRSTWADIRHSLEPLKSVRGAWPIEPLPKEVAQELIQAVAWSLQQAGAPDTEAIEALCEQI